MALFWLNIERTIIWLICFCCFFLTQGVKKKKKKEVCKSGWHEPAVHIALVSNLQQSSCLCFLSTGTISMHYIQYQELPWFKNKVNRWTTDQLNLHEWHYISVYMYSHISYIFVDTHEHGKWRKVLTSKYEDKWFLKG